MRLDQQATSRHQRDYMNQVLNGILNEVSTQMADDVNENIKNSGALYDYPWTKDTEKVAALFDDNSPALVNGSSTTGVSNNPDHKDDRWLASTAPVYDSNSGVYRWLHLTNIDGFWLDIPLPDNPNSFPYEQPINGNHSEIYTSDTDLEISTVASRGLMGRRPGGYETRGVDADGDGVVDSRWQWAPRGVRDLGGRKYVMALRIVDLNSMLNVNTAMALTRRQ